MRDCHAHGKPPSLRVLDGEAKEPVPGRLSGSGGRHCKPEAVARCTDSCEEFRVGFNRSHDHPRNMVVHKEWPAKDLGILARLKDATKAHSNKLVLMGFRKLRFIPPYVQGYMLAACPIGINAHGGHMVPVFGHSFIRRFSHIENPILHQPWDYFMW